MTRLFVAGVMVSALACGTAFAQSTSDVAAPEPAAQSSVKLRAVIVDLPAGTPWLSMRPSAFCIASPITQTWAGGRVPQAVSAYAPAFKAELEKAGNKVITPGEDNLFDPESASADYEAAAVIIGERIDGCMSKGGILTGTNPGDVKGDSSMMIDWQIYSPLKKQVVAHVSTSGAAHLGKAIPGGQQRLLLDSFAENAAALASNADFRAAMTAPKPLTAGFQTPGEQSKILLDGSLKAGPRKIGDAVGDVVTIMNDIGMGSGVLVSSDGYILTDAHVVGDDKHARVRWSDGFETLAEVVRVSKNRDVAIIKTNPRDRSPLAIKRGPVTPGARVYAIGSPNGKDFQGTVSGGVISADRVIDGLRYIQSDVSISPGSSGGALLDENGSVIGIAVSTFLNGGEPAGLNMFIPIGDAMDFLALEQQ
jgi:serine protease Do